jgi:NADH:ubiquinone oxidoreductase subunit 6 (subunit J)
MDSLHAIGFYVSSGVSLAGGLGVALLPSRGWRGAAMGVVGIGLTGIYLSLAAGFAAAAALVCYAGCALMLTSLQYRSVGGGVGPLWRQVGAIGAAGMLAVLAYSAFRGDLVPAQNVVVTFDATNLSRLFFARDALPLEAVAVLTLIALAGAAAVWRAGERTR